MQLEETVLNLSPDKRIIYTSFVENVEHFYNHRAKLCQCENYTPMCIFVSGFGGSGKSHLIRTLMAFQFIKSEIRHEPYHFILEAPTGIASCNVSGQTLHSLWQLPVENSNAKLQCCHIIDEVSMISNQMFVHAHQSSDDGSFLFKCSIWWTASYCIW